MKIYKVGVQNNFAGSFSFMEEIFFDLNPKGNKYFECDYVIRTA